ncbi:Clavaminate synthase-like protein [Jaminaea rosea]|uniref:Clavaminate synthase-like protein n=1 Tax=Jaminaea rosea TaxID=1569628 RepID=A0A316UV38_9BASI|nr:Clavaminate synthase-like protein [Jaminaea rosea]PWN26975.1 Clavaminate synthase-like protein [Jaminaea rosea]
MASTSTSASTSTMTAPSSTNTQPTRKRRRLSPSPPATLSTISLPHPLNIKPAGNALFTSSPSNRSSTLGCLLSRLPDDLIIDITSRLTPRDLARLSSVSSGCRAFANHESLWRTLCLDGVCPQGQIEAWYGSWKQTTGAHLTGKAVPPLAAVRPAQPFYSDVLYLPHRLSFTLIGHGERKGERRAAKVHQVERISANTTTHDFHTRYAALHRPCIVETPTDGNSSIPGLGMTIQGLKERYGQTYIRAEAVRARVETYADYAACCTRQQEEIRRAMRAEDQDQEEEYEHAASTSAAHPPWYDPQTIPDESPYYLFDSTIPTQLHTDGLWTVPPQLASCPSSAYPAAPTPSPSSPSSSSSSATAAAQRNADLFSLLSTRRPDYRWLIAGPARSGSGWHKDPNYTSAWNTPLSGSKRWLLLPPHVTPPGVYVSEDGAEVTAPLSLVEWFADFYDETLSRHGRGKGGDGQLLEGVCEAGETVYVPSGWWHLVVNLESGVALTQNFLSLAELPDVLEFMKNRPEQISGFKTGVEGAQGEDEDDDALSDEGKAKIYGEFVAALKGYDGELARWALQGAERLEQQRGQVRKADAAAAIGAGAGTGAVLPGKHANGGDAAKPSWWQRLKSGGDEGQAKTEAHLTTAGEGFSLGGLLGEGDGEELEDVPW